MAETAGRIKKSSARSRTETISLGLPPTNARSAPADRRMLCMGRLLTLDTRIDQGIGELEKEHGDRDGQHQEREDLADDIVQYLLKKGIIVRRMKSYDLPEWIRVSVGTPEQNERFLEVLKEALIKFGEKSA